jgi:hypothetical protein
MKWIGLKKEQFADFLVGISKSNQFDFSAKAQCYYNHIQLDSKHSQISIK